MKEKKKRRYLEGVVADGGGGRKKCECVSGEGSTPLWRTGVKGRNFDRPPAKAIPVSHSFGEEAGLPGSSPAGELTAAPVVTLPGVGAATLSC